MIDKQKTACFTGHRRLSKQEIEKLPEILDKVIDDLYESGVIFYGAGGAYGFDMLAEQAVLRAKTRHPDIKLILVLPCKEQEKYWSAENKAIYADLLSRADKVRYLSEQYYDGCMPDRNRRLVDYSGYCIAYMKSPRSGTSYTVNYAINSGLTVLNLAEHIKI